MGFTLRGMMPTIEKNHSKVGKRIVRNIDSLPKLSNSLVSVGFVSSGRCIASPVHVRYSKGGLMGCGSCGSWIVRCVELFSNLKTELILVFQETSTAQDHGHPRPSTRFTFWSYGGMLLVQNSVLKYALRLLFPFYCCHRYQVHTSTEPRVNVSIFSFPDVKRVTSLVDCVLACKIRRTCYLTPYVATREIRRLLPRTFVHQVE